MRRSAQRILALVLIGSCVSCDQATKQLAVEHLVGEPTRSYLGDVLRVQYVENTGAFLGMGADWPEGVRLALFVVMTGAILSFAAWSLWRHHERGRVETLGLLLLVAGGVGNLLDRVRLGYVVDFLNLGVGSLRTGIFNVADVAITIGALLLLVAPRPADAEAQVTTPTGDGV